MAAGVETAPGYASFLGRFPTGVGIGEEGLKIVGVGRTRVRGRLVGVQWGAFTSSWLGPGSEWPKGGCVCGYTLEALSTLICAVWELMEERRNRGGPQRLQAKACSRVPGRWQCLRIGVRMEGLLLYSWDRSVGNAARGEVGDLQVTLGAATERL